MRDKEVNNFIRLTNIETQSREAALIKTERMTQMTATIPPQTSTQQDSDIQDTSPNNGYKDTIPPNNSQ
ncbi:unnamed protein product [Rhizophagus irregularis]|nr:unnamed protein product [Rhizophagus irregularis]CAB5374533.1 unnamed protein product [Rhizophagus irregularis]